VKRTKYISHYGQTKKLKITQEYAGELGTQNNKYLKLLSFPKVTLFLKQSIFGHRSMFNDPWSWLIDKSVSS
jgi:hypothetical protein